MMELSISVRFDLAALRTHYEVTLFGIRRAGQALAKRFGATRLEENYALLLVGGWYRLRELQQERDFGRQLPYWSG